MHIQTATYKGISVHLSKAEILRFLKASITSAFPNTNNQTYKDYLCHICWFLNMLCIDPSHFSRVNSSQNISSNCNHNGSTYSLNLLVPSAMTTNVWNCLNTWQTLHIGMKLIDCAARAKENGCVQNPSRRAMLHFR